MSSPEEDPSNQGESQRQVEGGPSSSDSGSSSSPDLSRSRTLHIVPTTPPPGEGPAEVEGSGSRTPSSARFRTPRRSPRPDDDGPPLSAAGPSVSVPNFTPELDEGDMTPYVPPSEEEDATTRAAIDWTDREPSRNLWSSVSDFPEPEKQQRLMATFDMISNMLKVNEQLLLRANKRLRMTLPWEKEIEKLQEDVLKLNKEKSYLDQRLYEALLGQQAAKDDCEKQRVDSERSIEELEGKVRNLEEAANDQDAKRNEHVEYLESLLEANDGKPTDVEGVAEGLQEELKLQHQHVEELERLYHQSVASADGYKAHVDALTKEIEQIKTEPASAPEELQIQVRQGEEELSKCRDDLKKCRAENETLSAAIAQKEKEGDFATKQWRDSLEDNKVLMREYGKKQDALEKCRAENETLSAAIAQKEKEGDFATKQWRESLEINKAMMLELGTKQQHIDDMDKRMPELESRLHELTETTLSLKDALGQRTDDIRRLEGQQPDSYDEMIKKMANFSDAGSARVNEMSKEVAEAFGGLAEQERAELRELRAQLAAVNQHIQELGASRNAHSGEIEALHGDLSSRQGPYKTLVDQLAAAEVELRAMSAQPGTGEGEIERLRQRVAKFEQDRKMASTALDGIQNRLMNMSAIHEEQTRQIRNLRDKLRYPEQSEPTSQQGTDSASTGCHSEICFCSLLMWLLPKSRLRQFLFAQDCQECRDRLTKQPSIQGKSENDEQRKLKQGDAHEPEPDTESTPTKEQERATSGEQDNPTGASGTTSSDLGEEDQAYSPPPTTTPTPQPPRSLGHGHGGPPFRGPVHLLCQLLTALVWLGFLIVTQPYNLLWLWISAAGRLVACCIPRPSTRPRWLAVVVGPVPVPSASMMVGFVVSAVVVFTVLVAGAVGHERRIWMEANDWRSAYLRDILGERPYAGWSLVKVDFRLSPVGWLERTLHRMLFPERYSQLW